MSFDAVFGRGRHGRQRHEPPITWRARPVGDLIWHTTAVPGWMVPSGRAYGVEATAVEAAIELAAGGCSKGAISSCTCRSPPA